MACVLISSKRIMELPKKSPLKMISPIIKKYSSHRQCKTLKKLTFSRERRKKFPKSDDPFNDSELTTIQKEKIKSPEKEIKETETIKEIPNVKVEESLVLQDVKSPPTVPDHKFLSPTSTYKNKQNIINSAKKKANKQYRNIEATLELLENQSSEEIDRRQAILVTNYLNKIKERTDEETYEELVKCLLSVEADGVSPVLAYKHLETKLINYPDLLEEFLVFLSPEQAKLCGKFMEQVFITKMLNFIHTIDVVFYKSPQHIRKIHEALDTLYLSPEITEEKIKRTILPLLKGNSLLLEYFVQLLPTEQPPGSIMSDMNFEEIRLSQLKKDEVEICEDMELDDVEDDEYGTDHCICQCHVKEDDDKYKTRILHCVLCGTKFINGKIFIHVGKQLKPISVTFYDYDIRYHRKRLAPHDEKDKQQTGLLSSDEFKSDEDEHWQKLIKSPKKYKTITPTRIKKKTKCSRTIMFSKNKEESKKDKTENKKQEVKVQEIENVYPNKTVKVSQIGDHIKDNKIIKSANNKLCNREVGKNDSLSTKVDNEDGLSTRVDNEDNLSIKVEMEDNSCFSLDSEIRNISNLELYADVENIRHMPFLEDTSDKVTSLEERNTSPPVLSIPDSNSISSVISGSATPIISFLNQIDQPPEEIEKTKRLLFKENKVNKEIEIIDEDITNRESKEVQRNQGESSSIEIKEEEDKVVIENKDKTAEDSSLSSESNSSSTLKIEPWKIEEDRIILQTLQQAADFERTFIEIAQKMPHRTVEEIKDRFRTLMSILYEMRGASSE